jgi:hypothetical protein
VTVPLKRSTRERRAGYNKGSAAIRTRVMFVIELRNERKKKGESIMRNVLVRFGLFAMVLGLLLSTAAVSLAGDDNPVEELEEAFAEQQEAVEESFEETIEELEERFSDIIEEIEEIEEEKERLVEEAEEIIETLEELEENINEFKEELEEGDEDEEEEE